LLTTLLFVKSRPLLHGSTANATTLQQAQSRSQQMVVNSQDNKNDVLNQRSPAPESAMFGVPGVGHSKPALLSPGVNQSGNSVPLKGWPLTVSLIELEDFLRRDLLSISGDEAM
jgi:hypothetical protein